MKCQSGSRSIGAVITITGHVRDVGRYVLGFGEADDDCDLGELSRVSSYRFGVGREGVIA